MKRISFLFIALSFMVTLMAQSDHKTQNVILVTIDGFRWQEMFNGADSSFINNKQLVQDVASCSKKYWNNSLNARRKMLLPFIWNTVASKGQIYGNRTKGCKVNVKNPYWFSYPGYNEILTGYADTRINSNSYGPNPNVSLFEVMNRTPKYAGCIAAFTSWDAFNDILNEKRSGLTVSAGFDKVTEMDSDSKMSLLNSIQTQLPDIFNGVRLDGVTFNMGFEYLKVKRPRILFLSFDETDDFAHGGRYQDYLNSAHYTDDFLYTIWNWIQSDPQYKDKTTLLVTCDHGRGEGPVEWRSHGSKTANSNQTWFIAMGPDTPALGEMTSGQYYNNQFAETIAALLGFNFETPNPIGTPIVSVLGK